MANLAKNIFEIINGKNENKNNESLQDLVRDYYLLKKEIEKKELDLKQLNSTIKTKMQEQGLKKFIYDQYTALLITQNRVEFDDDKLISKLKLLDLNDCIKLVEKPNELKIEEKIVNSELNPNDLEECIKSNLIISLSIKKTDISVKE